MESLLRLEQRIAVSFFLENQRPESDIGERQAV